MSLPCKDCVSGVVHSGTPTGTTTKIHNVDTYVASPPNGAPPKGIIVVVPDVFGWTFSNTRVLADSYAKKGNFTVYVPDFMNGDHVNEDVLGTMDRLLGPSSMLIKPVLAGQVLSNFIPFLVRNRAGVARPRIVSFLKALRDSPETQGVPIGVAGFCWGGLHAAQAAHPVSTGGKRGKPLVDAAFVAHPVGLKLPADIEAVDVPFSLAIGNKDMAMNMKAVGQVQDTLGKKKTAGDHEVRVYDGAKHGFAIRSNPGDEKEKAAGIEAEDQAVAFFSKWLQNTSVQGQQAQYV
ncbi:MAG: hypothetical protein M1836_006490 [Candelina mexicana]|nr:MAG: hypothetical protein M1836_006490 [Candelina mexicana]